jgi:hypothetical protein
VPSKVFGSGRTGAETIGRKELTAYQLFQDQQKILRDRTIPSGGSFEVENQSTGYSLNGAVLIILLD